MALKLKGSTSGFVAIDAPSVAGNNTLILPENTGSAHQILANDITAGVTTFTQVTVSRNGDLTVPGTISIGGTLTYEDVTSVDSVGIVTARGLSIFGNTTGLQVASGISTFSDVSARNITGVAVTLTGALSGTTATLSGNLNLADSIIHSGDTNTKVRFPSADTVSVETAGSERLRINSGGKVLVNTTTASTVGNSQYSFFEVCGNTSGGTGAGHFSLKRGETSASLSDGDTIARLIFSSLDGGDFAYIQSNVDGSPSGSDFPASLRFHTCADGASTSTERMRIASNGFIGMGGATGPEEVLDLGNNVQINLKVGGRGYLGQGYSTAATILGHSVKAKTTGTVSGGMEVTETNSGGGAPVAVRMVSGTFQVHTAASGTSGATFDSEKLRITSAGEMGLGTATPPTGCFHIHLTETPELNLFSTQHAQNNTCKLNFGVGQSASVDGNTGARIEMNIPNSGGQMTGELKFHTNSGDSLSEAMRITSNGQLLVGTTTAPAYTNRQMTVGDTGDSASFIEIRTSTSGVGHVLFSKTHEANSGNYNAYIAYAHNTNLMTFHNNGGNERMRISEHGDLTLNSSATDTRLGIKSRSNATGLEFVTCRDTSDTLKFYIASSGATYNAANTYGSISDQSVKENIVDANSQWDDIKNIKVRNFNFTVASGMDTHTQIGCVAQEVETVSPKLISEKNGVKSVSYSILYMKAVKALQEAQTRIETLESKVAALEG